MSPKSDVIFDDDAFTFSTGPLTIDFEYDDSIREDNVIVDLAPLGFDDRFGGMALSGTEIRLEHSLGEFMKCSLEGFLIPTTEGGFRMTGRDRCHLCEAPVVNERQERQVYFDEEEVRHEKSVFVQTYECGTSVEYDSTKRGNTVKLGLKCIQLPSRD